MSEAHDKLVQPGDLVGIDTDANGFEGYVIDFSRTFLCGDRATEGQKEAYRVAYDCVNGMRELMKPGMTFEEFARAAPQLPPEYRNGAMAGWPTRTGSKTKGRHPVPLRRRHRRQGAARARIAGEHGVVPRMLRRQGKARPTA